MKKCAEVIVYASDCPSGWHGLLCGLCWSSLNSTAVEFGTAASTSMACMAV